MTKRQAQEMEAKIAATLAKLDAILASKPKGVEVEVKPSLASLLSLKDEQSLQREASK